MGTDRYDRSFHKKSDLKKSNQILFFLGNDKAKVCNHLIRYYIKHHYDHQTKLVVCRVYTTSFFCNHFSSLCFLKPSIKHIRKTYRLFHGRSQTECVPQFGLYLVIAHHVTFSLLFFAIFVPCMLYAPCSFYVLLIMGANREKATRSFLPQFFKLCSSYRSPDTDSRNARLASNRVTCSTLLLLRLVYNMFCPGFDISTRSSSTATITDLFQKAQYANYTFGTLRLNIQE